MASVSPPQSKRVCDPYPHPWVLLGHTSLEKTMPIGLSHPKQLSIGPNSHNTV